MRCQRGRMWPPVRRWGEMQALRWEVAPPLVAAVGPSPLAVPLLPSHVCLLAMCFCSGSTRERRNGAFQLLRNYHSLHSSLAASDVSLCSEEFEGRDRTCVSLSHVGFLQVTELPPCCGGGGRGEGSAAQAVRDVSVF